VRNRTQKSSLTGNEGLNPPRHSIKMLAKKTDLIAACVHRWGHSGADAAICDLARCLAQLQHGSGDVTSQPKTENTRNRQHSSQAKQRVDTNCS
jgi:hypothetical protein